MNVGSIRSAVHSGALSAAERTRQAFEKAATNVNLNCFTELFTKDAMAAAFAVDADPHVFPLAGVPFAAKNLFDVAGKRTLAGARINLDHMPAATDATAIARLKSAGAILIGLTNMDEYAYGFSTENAHFGTTRNPHDPTRIAGGSSGGSAAAVAAGIVPIALGSDTNGSIRVPASLCGVFGLKPTFGRLSRAGTFPFVHSLDHIGALARSVADLTIAYDTLQGADPRDPTCIAGPVDPTESLLDHALPSLRVGVLDDWFQQGASDQALAALDHVASGFRDVRLVTLEGAEAARSAAFCMTGIEGGSLHYERLRTRALDFDPAVRDRLLAGLLLPAHISLQTRRVRRRVKAAADALFQSFDLLLAPATPCSAPLIGEATMIVGGEPVSVRANLGLYTQPISFIGLPVVAAPVRLPGLPIGVQLIGPPWDEATILRAAAWLEHRGLVGPHALPTSESLSA